MLTLRAVLQVWFGCVVMSWWNTLPSLWNGHKTRMLRQVCSYSFHTDLSASARTKPWLTSKAVRQETCFCNYNEKCIRRERVPAGRWLSQLREYVHCSAKDQLDDVQTSVISFSVNVFIFSARAISEMAPAWPVGIACNSKITWSCMRGQVTQKRLYGIIHLF